jgi:DNA topoisomerase-6 subunit B
LAKKQPRRRRETAQSMAAKQREISVSEFFTKNKHLLGFDNPKKSLLTTVKEAVDNSLDACEEAGIVPEIWVHVDQPATNRLRVGIQDNGPGIVKRQIPLIFGKLLYGSKFHRLRMSRGQQGIGISAAGMNGWITTGQPTKIVSKTSLRKPAHYFEIQMDTKQNRPVIKNGRGDGVDIPPGEKGRKYIEKHGIEWVSHYDSEKEGEQGKELRSGTRVTIEMAGKFFRGRGSVEDYLEQTAIANPHVKIQYTDPVGETHVFQRSTTSLPPEPKEIKPHPYGIELGRLITMIKDAPGETLSHFFTSSFSRVSPAVARRICDGAGVSTRAITGRVTPDQAEKLFNAIQETKIKAPATDCISPIGEDLLLKGLHQVVPGEFYAAATRPPAVYRGNPFLIEVGLVYGGESTAQKITLDLLNQLLNETDARTLRQFLIYTFDGVGADGADRIIKESGFGTRQSPSKLKKADREKLHHAMKNVNLSEGQSMQVLRYANRVPLQFKLRDCAITQAVMSTNWKSYGLSQSRNSLPNGPVTVMVHMASVWVPFTSESKEAVASYPEIEKELRLALQDVGRKLGKFIKRRQKVKQESERRSIFLRYLKEVSTAVGAINGADTDELYAKLLKVAQRKTSEADVKLDRRGRVLDGDEELDSLFADKSVLIVKRDPLEDLLANSNTNGKSKSPQKRLFDDGVGSER